MSESPSYNLLEKPWIPVVWRPDAPEPRDPTVGIRKALKRAHKIKCISHTAPFIEFGLYRLLVTIVLDAHTVAGHRPTIGNMKAMLDAGRFDEDVLDGYLDCYGGGFDLWNEQGPFLQKPVTDGKVENVSKMLAPIPSGTKITLWHHYEQDETSLTEAEVARELCAVAPFCFDYAPKDICTVGGDPPLYVLVIGTSLFETIVYNLPRPNGRVTRRQELAGGPQWRCPIADAAAIPASLTLSQGWTWPVRQIRLVPGESSGIVPHAVNIAGSGKTAAKRRVKIWRDPNAGTITDSEGVRHIRGKEGMLIWRDFVHLFLVGSQGETLPGGRVRSRPEVVSNALRIMEGRLLRVAVYGFIDKGGRNNKVFRSWSRSVLTLPSEVARDSRLSARAIDAFKTTQKVADALQKALRMLRPPVKASKNKRPPPAREDTDALANFWQALEPLLTHSYLDDLAMQSAGAEKGLWEAVQGQAKTAFNRAAAPHRRDADGLFRVANASNWFERCLSRLLHRETNT